MSGTDETHATPAPAKPSVSVAKRILVLLAFGLLAAVAIGLGCETLGDVFDVEPALFEELAASTGANPPPALMERIRLSGLNADRLNAALVYGLFGAVAAAAFRIGAISLKLTGGNMIIRFVVLVVIGAVLGAGGGFVSETVGQNIELVQMDELYRTLLVHAPAFGTVGFAAGLAAGRLHGAVLGCFGGLLAVAVTTIVGMVLFPHEQTLRCIPQTQFLFTLWCLTTMLSCAVFVGRSISGTPRT
jgi:hypothetical protein